MIIRKNLSPVEFRQLAFKLGQKYKKRDVTIGLSGNLGSGKTTFVKQFAKALGIKQVKSPTFIVMAAYRLANYRIFFHLDLYRIKHAKQLRPLEIDETLKSKNRIIMIEWVDKFPSLEKKCNILIHLDIASKNKRNVYIKKP
jgi:tRNA threonylcarbamoyladenosine biosynthesis protein TsaE